MKVVREWLETLVIALVLALLIRTYLVESFEVLGASMEPTLYSGERLMVNKLVYRFRQPQRGDIIIFQYPLNPRKDYVKRVIAIAGDTVEIRLGRVYVNGTPIEEPYLKEASVGNYPREKVPQGTVFVLGDNRNNSEDSRIFGFVPLRNIKGEAWVVYWPPAYMKVVGRVSAR